MSEHSFRYDRNTKILTATYDNGAAFKFFDVPPALYDEMTYAPSETGFFNKRIWSNFEYSNCHHTVETLLQYVAENTVDFPENHELTINSRTYEKAYSVCSGGTKYGDSWAVRG